MTNLSLVVIDTGNKLPLVSLTPATNLLPVSALNLPPVSVAKFAVGVTDTMVHLDLRISLNEFSKKNRNGPNVIIRGLEEDGS